MGHGELCAWWRRAVVAEAIVVYVLLVKHV